MKEDVLRLSKSGQESLLGVRDEDLLRLLESEEPVHFDLPLRSLSKARYASLIWGTSVSVVSSFERGGERKALTSTNFLVAFSWSFNRRSGCHFNAWERKVDSDDETLLLTVWKGRLGRTHQLLVRCRNFLCRRPFLNPENLKAVHVVDGGHGSGEMRMEW